MGTKTDAPKLSPSERLARKRAAARLRQQRCRARKRQAMLEKKRGDIARHRCAKLTRDPSTIPTVNIHAVQHRPQSFFSAYKPIHPPEAAGEHWAIIRGKGPSRQQRLKSSSEPIFNCVSFDSQKSLEEANQNVSRVSTSPPRSPRQKSPIVVTPSRTPSPGKSNKVVRVLSEEKVEDSLVPEEEAAVVAMLSLKSGSTNPSEKKKDVCKNPPSLPQPPREVMISHKLNTYASSGTGAKESEQIPYDRHKHSHNFRPQEHRRIVRHFEVYNYGQPMKIPPPPRRAQVPPGYYRVHAPVPHPHPHYPRGYYPPAPRYIAYE